MHFQMLIIDRTQQMTATSIKARIGMCHLVETCVIVHISFKLHKVVKSRVRLEFGYLLEIFGSAAARGTSGRRFTLVAHGLT